MSVLHILYQSSNTYVVPLGISMYSLLKNNTGIQTLHLHIISDGIQEENRVKLECIAQRFDRAVEWLDGDAISKVLESQGVPRYNGSYTTYMKLFAPNIVRRMYPDGKKLLYIDSDTLVTGSLEDLADLDMGQSDLGGVYEFIPLKVRQKSGIRGHSVNGGVLLFNLECWEQHGVEERILEKLRDREFAERLTLADQELINVTLQDSVYRLPVKYNCTTWFYYFCPASRYVRRLKMAPGFYLDSEVEADIRSPAIIHYLDLLNGRPWDVPNASPFSAQYAQYKAEAMPDEVFTTVTRKGLRRFAKNMFVQLYSYMPREAAGNFYFWTSKLLSFLHLS